MQALHDGCWINTDSESVVACKQVIFNNMVKMSQVFSSVLLVMTDEVNHKVELIES